MLPRAKGELGAGRAFFDFLLRRVYFLDEDAAQLEARGAAILARTKEELDALSRRIDPQAKSWFEVADRLKKTHPRAEELLDTYRAEVQRARRFVVEKDVVPLPPGDDCQVMETPPFDRATIVAEYDGPPAFDPTTRGFFFVTPIDRSLPLARQEETLREHDHGDQVNTTVHETYPGHHVQLSLARLHPSPMRKLAASDVFIEGWGLYVEELMNELGYYTDEERLMQLRWTLVRAARVLIDVGLHTKGMSVDEAVKMLVDTAHLERDVALSEVRRYAETPTQPLSYLVGREQIFKLRERFKARAGASYSLKKFHEDLLSHGSIPLGLVEREMFGEE
jgi:uncharacterized protein (DUF885 family)